MPSATETRDVIVMALLANPSCGKEADGLAALYDKVNEASQ